MLLFALASLSQAFVFVGNPKLNLTIDRAPADLVEGTATLDLVRVYKCGGGYTDYQVDAPIDPVAGFELTIGGGNLCSVGFRWTTDVWVESSSYVLRYEELTTLVTIGSSGTGSAPYDPFVVESGTFSGADPVFEVWFE